jgi:hypothetical protein
MWLERRITLESLGTKSKPQGTRCTEERRWRLDLSMDIPAICHRCGLVALRRDDLLRRYGCDYPIDRLYNDGHRTTAVSDAWAGSDS